MTSGNETAATLLRPVILLLIMVIAFTERLYSVLSYESIIHEVSTSAFCESASFVPLTCLNFSLIHNSIFDRRNTWSMKAPTSF